MRNALRWLTLLPAASLAAILSSFPLHLVLYQTITGSGIVEPYPVAPERLLMPLTAAVAFIWIGTRVAPHRKSEAATALFGLWLLLTGGAAALGMVGARMGNMEVTTPLAGIPILRAISGAFLGLCLARRDAGDTATDVQIARLDAPVRAPSRE